MIKNDIQQAAEILRNDGVIGLPTETVYGLAGNAFSEQAINQIFAMKMRPHFNPLIVHVKSFADVYTIATDIPRIAKELANWFWPGPLTMLLKKNPSIPDLVTAGKPTVAIRIPNHPIALSLLNTLDFPLAAPSANPFGMISPSQASHVDAYFPETYILEGGDCEKGIESTIIGFEGDKVLVYRLGSISMEQLKTITPYVELVNKNDTNPDAPGMLSKHYSPKTPLYVTDDVKQLASQFATKKIGLLLFDKALGSEHVEIVLSPSGDLREAASKLYASLHRFDRMDLDVIIATQFPAHAEGLVINDKLSRASLNK